MYNLFLAVFLLVSFSSCSTKDEETSRFKKIYEKELSETTAQLDPTLTSGARVFYTEDVMNMGTAATTTVSRIFWKNNTYALSQLIVYNGLYCFVGDGNKTRVEELVAGKTATHFTLTEVKNPKYTNPEALPKGFTLYHFQQETHREWESTVVGGQGLWIERGLAYYYYLIKIDSNRMQRLPVMKSFFADEFTIDPMQFLKEYYAE